MCRVSWIILSFQGIIASKITIVFFFLFSKGWWGRLDERMANLFILWWILPKNWVNFDSSSDRSWKIILRKFEGTLLFKKIRQEGKTLRTSKHVCYILISQRKLFIGGRNFVWCVKHIFIQPLHRNIQFIQFRKDITQVSQFK